MNMKVNSSRANYKRYWIKMGKNHNNNNNKFVLMVTISLLMLLILTRLTFAEKASSEVWSDSDGVQVKYSTDHETASEMSLSSDKRLNAVVPSSETQVSTTNQGGAATAGDRSDSSTTATDEEQEQGNNQRPYAGGSSEAGYESPQSGAQRSEPSDQLSYKSAAELVSEPDDEQNNIDHGEDNERRGQEAGAKFRSPGRLFKEAIRVNSGVGDDNQGGKNSDESVQSSSDDSSEGSGSSGNSSGSEESNEPSEQASWGRPDETSGGSIQGQTGNMVDFDRLASKQRQLQRQQHSNPLEDDDRIIGGSKQSFPNYDESEATNSEDSGSSKESSSVDEDEDESGQSMSSTKHHRPEQRTSAPSKEIAQKSKLRSSMNIQSELGSRQQNKARVFNKQPSQQLSYFRGAQQQFDNKARQMVNVNSPDSVRDEFISPGHFPGSMPHLTQAASEVSRNEKKTSSPSLSSSSEKLETSSISDNEGVIKDSSADQMLVASGISSSKAKIKPEEDGQKIVTVTPEPETAESQQVMPPILVTTTTPMPAQLPTTKNITFDVNSDSNLNSTSSAQNILKRFKLRKLR